MTRSNAISFHILPSWCRLLEVEIMMGNENGVRVTVFESLKITVQVSFKTVVYDMNLSTGIMVVICQVFLITVMYLFSTFKYSS